MPAIDRAIARATRNEYRRQIVRRSQGTRKTSQVATGTGGSVVQIAGQTFPAAGISDVGRVTLAVRNVGRPANAVFAPDRAAVVAVSSSLSIPGAGGGGGSYSAGNGILIAGGEISILLRPGQTSLVADGNGLAVAPAMAGAGLTIDGTTRVLSVGQGDGITVAADTVGVDSTVVRITRRVDSGAGLTGGGDLSADRTLAVGTGFGLLTTADTVYVNEAMAPVWIGEHRFNVTPQIYANLAFQGGNRTITASNALTLSPTSDLRLDPGGVIALPNDQTMRTDLFTDSVTGILGQSNFEQGGNVRQLTIGAIKADEIFVRYFTADEVRVNRGEEMWSRSYGIVETDFDLPSINSTVDVWFEEAPDLAEGQLFADNNWLIARTINLDGPNLAMRVYFQVVGSVGTGYLAREDAAGDKVSRQQWRIRRMFGGFDATSINKGVTLVDIGQPQVNNPGDPGYVSGQGIVYLSALKQDGGPFIETEVFHSVIANVPQFRSKTRMGNLLNTVDYTVDTFGFATGNNLGLLPSAGFSGIVSDEVDGVRMFNTATEIYESNIPIIRLNPTRGLDIREDPDAGPNANRNISWLADIDSPTVGARSSISGYRQASATPPHVQLEMYSTNNNESGVEARTRLAAIDPQLSTDGSLLIRTRGTTDTGATNSIATLFAKNVVLGERVGVGLPALHASWGLLAVVANDTAINRTAGITVAQYSTGDAVQHWYVDSGSKWYTAGIDNSDGDKWKLSASESLGTNDIFIYDPSTGAVTINGLDVNAGTPPSGLVAGDGITIVGTTIAVDSSVLRTARNLTAGDGLTGGGDLSADRTFNVDGTVVRTGRLITAGAGLTGGGSLGADLTLAVGAGDGISVTADAVAVDGTVVRTTRVLTAGDGLTGGGTLASDVNFAVGAGDGISVSASSVAVDSSVVRTSRTISTSGALAGGGDLSANRALSLTLAAASGLNQTAGLALDDSVAGNGLDIINKIMSVKVGTGLVITADTVTVDLPALVDTAQGTGVNAGKLQVMLQSPSGLALGATGLALADSVAGNGLSIASKVMTVNALSTGGLTVAASGVSVLLPANSGLSTSAAGLTVALAASSGLTLAGGLALADTVAGDGLAISASKVLSVNAGTGLLVATDTLIVNQGYTFNWTAQHTFSSGALFNAGTFQFNTAPQVNSNLDFIGGARTITSTGNLTLAVGGDIVLSPTGEDVLPLGSYNIDLGDYNRKFRTLYVAELYTETIVAQGVMATIGGRILVTPTTSITADVAPTDTVIITKHNNLTDGMYVRLESAPAGVPQFEVMKVAVPPVAVPLGWQYSVTRNVDGTGANSWLAGDGVASLGASVGEGWIDLTSTSTVLNDLGPTIAIYSRHGTLNWNDAYPVVAMGNLESFVDYSSATFGLAIGNNLTLDSSNGFSGITVDRVKGVRLFNTELSIYNAGNLEVDIDLDDGIRLIQGATFTAVGTNDIAWHKVLEPETNEVARLRSVITGTVEDQEVDWLGLESIAAGSTRTGYLLLSASNSLGSAQISLASYRAGDGDRVIYITADQVRLSEQVRIGDPFAIPNTTKGTLLIASETKADLDDMGLWISGYLSADDPLLHFGYYLNESEWTLGVDRSDSNKLKLAVGKDITVSPALTIDQSGSVSIGADPLAANQLHMGGSDGYFASNRYVASQYGPGLVLRKSRNATVGGHTIVQSGDQIGNLSFQGSDGTTFREGASIRAEVDGTPGVGDMPGRLVFMTTPDGSATPVTRMRIANDGDVFVENEFTAGSGSGQATITVDGGAGSYRQYAFMTNGVLRWVIEANTTAESGSNVGSDFQVRRRTDAGASLDTPFLIKRSNGFAGFNYTDPQAQIHVQSDYDYNSTTPQGIFTDVNGRQVAIGAIGMYRRDTDNDAGDLRFNFLGYNGGQTRFRDFTIYDGKGTSLLYIDGSAQTVKVTGDIISESGYFRRDDTTGTLTIVAGDTYTNGPYFSLIGKDVGGSTDGSIDYVSSQESSAQGYHTWYVYNPAIGWTQLARLNVDGVMTLSGVNVGESTLTRYNDVTSAPPTVTATSPPSNVVYSVQQGFYSRHNNTVTWQCRVAWTSATGGSGLLRVNLPFTAYSSGPQILTTYETSGAVTYGIIPTSGTYAEIGHSWASSGDLRIGGSYFAA